MKMKDLLDIDPSVLCISAWNDNGFNKYAHDPYRFQRSEFFPGLGWMIKREVWDEVKTSWPKTFWDEHFRNPTTSKGRSCIYPEISRVENFGMIGVSVGKFYLNYVHPIKRNTQKVNYENVKIGHLIQENYEASFFEQFKKAIPITLSDYEAIPSFEGHLSYKIQYTSRFTYQKLCIKFGITHSTRYHIPRTSYHKITFLNLETHSVFLYPSSDTIELDEGT
ncbi:Alpha-1,3-mannosyl-glycoprotein 2-beta-N-acetylglucosaminyltransferase [Thelohanellus kitauei]|uniref:Alpha-1,3-mannosyl-glycoprotein 2-beta-N-acetylglucosaminyltransferase n=1 Tax=Thelohanellus kitauei TaxID=669202 RepID=A0A0C2MQ72_THEKT|nr:Alpha-1,3-mannosyl-glycoprotein 2-beta-N-acetylglucosaminyltransferase [Thelohanellus kitauei]